MKQLRYFIEALLIYPLYYGLAILPMRISSNLMGGILRVVGPHLAKHQTALKNLAIALPELSEKERLAIACKMWTHLGRLVGEFPHLSTLSNTSFYKRVTVVGTEHLDDLIVDYPSVLFVSAHLGNWEICPRISVRHGFPLGVLYRAANNPWLERLITKGRTEPLLSMFAKSTQGARQMTKHIKKNQGSVAILADQKMNNGIAVPFFGHDVMTSRILAQLALQYNMPIIPTRVLRHSHNPHHFTATIDAPFYLENTGDKEHDIYQGMCRIHQILETWIRKNPEQWLWIHNRWPKDMPNNRG
jgi:KDO2-lipid IV(A) lauroyltransferase